MPKARRRDPDAIGESVKRAVRAAIASRWGKKPLCIVLVVVV
jgi:ribonuclease J